jgi:hypothetical protein
MLGVDVAWVCVCGISSPLMGAASREGSQVRCPYCHRDYLVTAKADKNPPAEVRELPA